MSREQLSTLMLGYAANAADILELFESLNLPEIVLHTEVTIGILFIYTWALLQFALIPTAVQKKRSKDEMMSQNTPVFVGTQSNTSTLTSALSSRFEEKTTIPEWESESNSPDEESYWLTFISCTFCCSRSNQCGRKLHPEYPQLLVTLLMQDGPFVILRIFLTIRFNVTSELHLFFLCKNALVCILLLHRLIVLAVEENSLNNFEEQTERNDAMIYVNDNASSSGSMSIDNYRLSTFL